MRLLLLLTEVIMKKALEQFSRITALVLLVTVAFMSCFTPANPPEEPLKLTPGVGTPRTFYLDSDGNVLVDSEGNVLETEPDGTGRTGLVVEDNKLAEGILIYSDDTAAEDRVAFVYGDSIVSMFFKKGSNFPHRMAITDGSEDCTAYISPYNAENNTYHVAFLDNRSYWRGNPIVLNGNIRTLYEDDPDLSGSQNRRMANMTIAMGVWGSLYASFEKQTDPFYYMLQFRFNAVVTVFSYVAVAATVVATVVAPIVSFISPDAELVIANVVPAVAAISTEITYASSKLVEWLEALEAKPVVNDNYVYVDVSRIVLTEDGEEKEVDISYNDNDKHDEFHILPNEDLKIKFHIEGFNTDNLPVWSSMVWYDEPNESLKEDGVPNKPLNLDCFTSFPPSLTKVQDKQDFFVTFTREKGVYSVPRGDGKINFCFMFNFVNQAGNPLDVVVNGYAGGFDFRLPQDGYELKRYKNMAVIHFCMKTDCPDIPPEPVTGGDEDEDEDEGSPP
jgi:hypothetical protein